MTIVENAQKRLTATQLCVINALQGNCADSQRRLSQSMPVDKQTAEIISNYGGVPPSVSYPCQQRGSKRLFIWKNLTGVSFGVLCLLVAYNAFFYVQSSLNSDAGLGSLSLAVDYVAQVVSSLFIPATLMKKIGCKWTLVVSMLGVILYLAANLYPRFETLVPAAAIMGVGFASMWATMNSLVTELSVVYAKMTGMAPNIVSSRFFGIFYMTIETAKIWGNLLSSQILSSKEGRYPNASQLAFCGAEYCNQPLSFYTISSGSQLSNQTANLTVNETNFVAASGSRGGATEVQVFTLGGVSLGISCLAVLLIAALLDSPRSKTPDKGSLLSRVLSTVRLLGNNRLLLLVFLTVDAGLVQSFFVGDLTKAFMTCSLGIHHVGLVSTCYGLTTVLGSISMGYLAQWVGRPTLIIIAGLLNLGDLCLMLFWSPDPEALYVYYIMAGIWGIALSVWLTQLSALYAEVFKDKHQEGFSNHRMLECIGFAIGFSWEHFVCMKMKIYVTLGMLVLGIIGYIGVEVLLRKDKKTRADEEDDMKI